MAKMVLSQKECILTFMKNNMDVFLGAQAGSGADPIYIRTRFDELTAKLNALGPPFKSRKAWRKTWSAMCRRAISKVFLYEKSKKHEPSLMEKYVLAEKKILDLISQAALYFNVKNQRAADEEPDEEEDVIPEDYCMGNQWLSKKNL